MSENQLIAETEQVEDPSSAEDKFFGVKTTFEKKQKTFFDSSLKNYRQKKEE